MSIPSIRSGLGSGTDAGSDLRERNAAPANPSPAEDPAEREGCDACVWFNEDESLGDPPIIPIRLSEKYHHALLAAKDAALREKDAEIERLGNLLQQQDSGWDRMAADNAALKERAERAEAALERIRQATKSWGHGEDCQAHQYGADDEEFIDASKCDCGFTDFDEARRAAKGG